MVFRLLYVSAVTLEAGSRLQSTVEDILLESVPRNARDGITGFLLCDGVSFVQVLEGPRSEVRACFERICADRRNFRVALREQGRVESRAFPRWAMAALTLSPRDDLLFPPAELEFEIWRASPGALLQYLCGVAARHGEALEAAHADILARSGGV